MSANIINDQTTVLRFLVNGWSLLITEISRDGIVPDESEAFLVRGDEPQRRVETGLADLLITQKLVEEFDADDEGRAAYSINADGRRWLKNNGVTLVPLIRSTPRAVKANVAPSHAPIIAPDIVLPDLGYNPSSYQRAIFAWQRTGRGDGIVNAVAGAGKTLTLTSSARFIRGEGLFLAFNKSIAEALGLKLRGTRMTAKTIHAMGFAAVRSGLKRMERPDDAKYPKLIEMYVQNYKGEFPDQQAARARLRKLVNFARLTLTPLDNDIAIDDMAVRYNLEFEDGDSERVRQLIRQGDAQADEHGIIDFTDMLWLTVTRGYRLPRLPWVMVDECQDLNAAQLALVLRLRAEGGRMLFVGDPNQAIMGFAGADTQSYETIRDTLSAHEMPLSICYRCPESHVALARELVPQIEARPNAPRGEVHREDENNLARLVKEQDMIICRRNAPLIKHCLRLINAGRAARIKGRDIGKELAELIRTVGKMLSDYRQFPEAVERWAEKQREALEAKNATESAFELVTDKAEALQACYANSQAASVQELAATIEALFADDNANIWLSSVHRAKGLEENRVFILEFDRLGDGRPKQSADELQQERNLKYVALTRAKQTLYLMN